MTDKTFTQYSDYPTDIARALHRANAYWYMDRITNVFIIESRNRNEPLTDRERKRIREYLRFRLPQFEIKFI